MSTCHAPHSDLQVNWKEQHTSQQSLDHILKREGLNLVLLGKMGAGKSSTGNTILGQEAFISKKSSKSVTKDVAVESGKVGDIPVTVYDTPGLFNSDMNDDQIQQMIKEKVLQKCESGLCVFLLVIKADKFSEKERKTVEKIEKLLGEKRLEKTWILFTRGDELEDENMTIKEFIDDTEPLKKHIQKYDQRYHVFNNKKKKQTEQVQGLFIKILQPYFDTQGGEEAEILKLNPLKRKTRKDFEPDSPVSSVSSRRIVLLGKSGVGKSAAGNTILGQKEFDSVMRMNSVTRECSVAHATVSGRSVSVVDTPGLFDTQMKLEELVMEIAKSIYISNPGPHAFIIVFPVNMRFTEQEQQIPQIIEMLFGKGVLKYSIILFTHGDQIDGESVEKLIKQNCTLRNLVDQCGGRFHVFNNKDQNNREQVNDLLQKIDTMIEQNGGGHYSNQMLEDAERFRREEEEERQREEEERKQQVEKQIQEEIERVRKETEERVRVEMRAEAQRKEFEREMKEAEERIRAKYEEESNKGFGQFLSKYWGRILMGAAVVGLIGCGAGIALLAVGKVAAGAAGASVAVGAAGAVGTGVYYYKHTGERREKFEREMKEAKEKEMEEEKERIKAKNEAKRSEEGRMK